MQGDCAGRQGCQTNQRIGKSRATDGLAKKLEIAAESTEPSANTREKGEAVDADGTVTTVSPKKWGYRAFWSVDQRRRNIASIRSVTRKPPTTL